MGKLLNWLRDNYLNILTQKVRYMSLGVHDQAESRALRRGFLVSGKAKRSFKLWKKLQNVMR